MRTQVMKHRNHLAPASRSGWLAATTLVAVLLSAVFAASPGVTAGTDPVERGIEADAARYRALAEFYQAEAGAAIQRGIETQSARYQAMGQYYAQQAGAQFYTDVSKFYVERMRAQARQETGQAMSYTDVSRFYAERMRDQARLAAALAANPELSLAHRSYRAAADSLALNPELGTARLYYRLGDVVACSTEEDQMVAGPEPVFYRRLQGC